MRRVSGDTGQRLSPPLGRIRVFGPRAGETRAAGKGIEVVWSATVADGAEAPTDSTVAISVPDAIEGFYLGEIRVGGLELLSQPLDVAVHRSVVDVNMLAIRRVHQLVAVLDVPWTMRERFEDQELGHRQLDRLAALISQMARGDEDTA